MSGEAAPETGARAPSTQQTPKRTDQEFLDEFVTKVEAIVMTTTREWRRALQDRLRTDNGRS